MEKQNMVVAGNESSLANVIATIIKLPGVKVNRELFLRQQFAKCSRENVERIVEVGPVEAGCDQKTLRHLASGLINNRTLMSTAASFAAGLPGGFAMAATIPADMVQFYAVALRTAQELAYLYGESDFWDGSELNMDMVTSQLILYCGVMLGASGAASTVRVMSSALAKQALKKLPQKALTKTFYYPVVKSIAKAFGVKMTKSVFAKGVSKAIPLIGGVVSGGITFASMIPMCKRLADTMEKAHFDYSEEALARDWVEITEICEAEERVDTDSEGQELIETDKTQLSANVTNGSNDSSGSQNETGPMEHIKQAKELLDCGAINQEEFERVKQKWLGQL